MMFEGINVLETITKREVPLWEVLLFVAIVLFVVLHFVVQLVGLTKGDEYRGLFPIFREVGDYPRLVPLAILLDLIVVASSVTTCFATNIGYNTFDTTYRVTIDKSVSMVEFDEKYEVLQRNGDEYIIREIEKVSEKE